MNIRITMTEELLGTKPANKDVFASFVASKAPDDDKRREELETAEHIEEAGTTVFAVKEGCPGVFDYQLKGFMKDACGMLRRADDTKSKDFSAYKTKIDGLVFVEPRFIKAIIPQGGDIGICERPLRADTAQGPRVSLCRSQTLPKGTQFEFKIRCLSKALIPLILEWFAYGELRGLGQWRNSGCGKFSTEVLPDDATA